MLELDINVGYKPTGHNHVICMCIRVIMCTEAHVLIS